MDQSPRFSLPFLSAGQAQKEWFHNEALQLVEMLLCPVVEAIDQVVPPPAPEFGSCYLVGAGASDDWAGRDGNIACFADGGWRFVIPVEAMQVVEKASGQTVAFRSGNWESGIVRARELQVNGQAVVRQQQPAIADPNSGGVIDAECRAAVAAMLAALRAHGLIG